jgi:hypothetical protein
MRTLRTSIIVIIATVLVLAGCAPAHTEPNAAGLRPILVENVQVEIGVGSPIPVDVLVAGTWPDLCAQLARVTQQIDGNTIAIELLATAEVPDCPPDFVGVPFRIAIPLNAVELPAGTYAVSVNGRSAELVWPPGPMRAWEASLVAIPLTCPAPQATVEAIRRARATREARGHGA